MPRGNAAVALRNAAASGSTTVIVAGARPASIHPLSRAPPILPQPTSRIPPAALVMRSCLADGFEQRGGDRLFGGLTAPGHELEGGVEALAFGERDVDHVFELLDAGALRAAQQHGV